MQTDTPRYALNARRVRRKEKKTTTQRYQVIAAPDFLICAFCSSAAHEAVRLATATGTFLSFVLLFPPRSGLAAVCTTISGDHKWLPRKESRWRLLVLYCRHIRSPVDTHNKKALLYVHNIFRVSARLRCFFFYYRTSTTNSVAAEIKKQWGTHVEQHFLKGGSWLRRPCPFKNQNKKPNTNTHVYTNTQIKIMLRKCWAFFKDTIQLNRFNYLFTKHDRKQVSIFYFWGRNFGCVGVNNWDISGSWEPLDQKKWLQKSPH